MRPWMSLLLNAPSAFTSPMLLSNDGCDCFVRVQIRQSGHHGCNIGVVHVPVAVHVTQQNLRAGGRHNFAAGDKFRAGGETDESNRSQLGGG